MASETAGRIRRGFFRLGLVLGLVAAVPGGLDGFAVSGPSRPPGLERKTELERLYESVLEQLAEEYKLRGKPAPGDLDTRGLKALTEVSAEHLEADLEDISAYQTDYPGIWYQQPKWFRGIIAALAGASIAFLVVFGAIRAVG